MDRPIFLQRFPVRIRRAVRSVESQNGSNGIALGIPVDVSPCFAPISSGFLTDRPADRARSIIHRRMEFRLFAPSGGIRFRCRPFSDGNPVDASGKFHGNRKVTAAHGTDQADAVAAPAALVTSETRLDGQVAIGMLFSVSLTERAEETPTSTISTQPQRFDKPRAVAIDCVPQQIKIRSHRCTSICWEQRSHQTGPRFDILSLEYRVNESLTHFPHPAQRLFTFHSAASSSACLISSGVLWKNSRPDQDVLAGVLAGCISQRQGLHFLSQLQVALLAANTLAGVAALSFPARIIQHPPERECR